MCNPYNKLSNKANVSSLNPFSCKIQIFKVRVKVSYLLRNFEKLQRFFTGEPCHSGHEHGVRRFFFFSGVSFHLRRCPQGVASVLCKKTPILGSRRSKLDHLTVSKGPVDSNLSNSSTYLLQDTLLWQYSWSWRSKSHAARLRSALHQDADMLFPSGVFSEVATSFAGTWTASNPISERTYTLHNSCHPAYPVGSIRGLHLTQVSGLAAWVRYTRCMMWHVPRPYAPTYVWYVGDTGPLYRYINRYFCSPTCCMGISVIVQELLYISGQHVRAKSKDYRCDRWQKKLAR